MGGRLVLFGIINRAVTADTRGAPLLGRKKEVGHQDTERPGLGGASPWLRGVLKGCGDSSGRGGGRGRRAGYADPTRRAHLAPTRRVHAGGGRLLGAPAVPLARAAAPHRGQRATAPRAEGLVVPRDSGREPEPLCAFTPQARPEPASAWVLAPLSGCEPRL